MGLFSSILKAFVGDKAKKDLKLILPIVDEIKKIGVDLEKLTNDELRQKQKVSAFFWFKTGNFMIIETVCKITFAFF